MNLNFPAEPENGDTYEGYVYDASITAWKRDIFGSNRFLVSATTPVNAISGDLWFDSSELLLYAYYVDEDSSQWVQVVGERGFGIPLGGATGQVLAKTSGSDYAVDWADAASSVANLTDVDLTGLDDGSSLVYDQDSSSWVTTIIDTDVSVSELTDVNLEGLADGNSLIYDSVTGTWIPGEGGGKFSVSDTAPEEAESGDVWFNSTSGKTYIYYEDDDSTQWVEIASTAVGYLQIEQLNNVNIISPENGEVLKYDSATSKWINGSIPEPVLTFSGLEDTSIATPATGDSLVYDGSGWVNQPRAGRNLLYNGAMQVHQRGVSATGITAGGFFTADRWYFEPTSMGTWTQTVENDGPTGSGFQKSVKVLCTTADAAPAADDQVRFRYFAEGQDLQVIRKGTSSAQQLTASFWVKSNVTGTYIAELNDADNGRVVSFSYTVSNSATWEKKTIVIPADTTGAFDNDNQQSLQINWFLGAGSNRTSGTLQTTWGSPITANRAVGQTNLAAATNNYWQITGVQLEVGPVATPFEFKSAGQELAECQRYYQEITSGLFNAGVQSGIADTQQRVLSTVYLPVPLRTTSATISIPSMTSNFSWVEAGNQRTTIGVMSSNSSVMYLYTSWTGTALSAYVVFVNSKIQISAEL